MRGSLDKDIRTFKIQPAILFSHSPYFRRQLRKRDGRPRAWSFEDLELDGNAMAHFATYCNTDTLYDLGSQSITGSADVLREMLDVYFLAEKLEEIPLMNLAITKAAFMGRKHGALLLRLDCVRHIYERCRSGHELRRYVVDLYAWGHDSDNAKFLSRTAAMSSNTVPREFLVDMLQAQSMKLGSQRTRHEDPNQSPQKYHKQVICEISDDEGASSDDETIFVDSDG